MELPLPPAAAADVLRAHTKDQEYISLIDASLSQLLRLLLSPQLLSHPSTKRVTNKLARFAYYLFTCAPPLYATPGEQYASVVPVILRANRSVSLIGRVRVVFVALAHLCSSSDVTNVLAAVWNRRCPSLSFPRQLLEKLLEHSLRFHLALFYLRGRYGCVVRRLFGVRYLATSNLLTEHTLLPFLGAVMMLMLLSHASSVLYTLFKRFRAGGVPELLRALSLASDAEEKQVVPGRPTCILCLGAVRDATLTSCGHVFCWNCICHWCSSNQICPLCRQQVLTRKLVCLYNY